MSVVNQRKTTTVRHEYMVPQPAAAGDVQEAMAFARRDKAEAGLDVSYDDSLMVTHDDENIIVYWEEAKR